MALLNIVRNETGTEIAGFLSSLDARRYAQEESGFYNQLTVTDFGGTVTRHIKGKPIAIVIEGSVGSVRHLCEHFGVSKSDPVEA